MRRDERLCQFELHAKNVYLMAIPYIIAIKKSYERFVLVFKLLIFVHKVYFDIETFN